MIVSLIVVEWNGININIVINVILFIVISIIIDLLIILKASPLPPARA